MVKTGKKLKEKADTDNVDSKRNVTISRYRPSIIKSLLIPLPQTSHRSEQSRS